MTNKSTPVAWAIQACSRMWTGEFAEIDAKAEAARCGGSCYAYPLYAAAPAAPQPCTWSKDPDYDMGDTYHSACGEAWSFIDGGPAENRMRYCHGCGKPVIVISDGQQELQTWAALTDAEIIDIAERTKTAEPGRDGYVLPISFARAILAAHSEATK